MTTSLLDSDQVKQREFVPKKRNEARGAPIMSRGFLNNLGTVLRDIFGSSPTPPPSSNRLRDEPIREMLMLIERGIQIRFSSGTPPSIALNENEQLLCYAPTTLVEPRAIRAWRGAYGGPSFRIAKGISFRVGGTGGTSESHDEMRSIDQGMLALTNQRIIFVGSARTVILPVDKVVQAENDGHFDWLRLNVQGRQKAIAFEFSSDLWIAYTYDVTIRHAPFHSAWLKAAIDQVQHPERLYESRRDEAKRIRAEQEELVERGLQNPLTPFPPFYGFKSGDTPAEPNPIVLCVTCRSKNIAEKQDEGRVFVCNECGTTLQQVDDKYKLVRSTDVESPVWKKYAGKSLSRLEWSNIANGGLSDEEIASAKESQSPLH